MNLAAVSVDDGVPEAVECPEKRIYGVQWHPERMAFAQRRPDTVDGSRIFRFSGPLPVIFRAEEKFYLDICNAGCYNIQRWVMRECWNWQTGTFEVRVSTTYGFQVPSRAPAASCRSQVANLTLWGSRFLLPAFQIGIKFVTLTQTTQLCGIFCCAVRHFLASL